MRTAAVLAIGDELLSGRTRDANIHALAGWLTARGIALKEARIVSDDEAAIVETVNDLRGRYDYVFTSGGLGPTHDDITAEAIASAFGVSASLREDAKAILAEYYKDTGLTDARLRMARIPEGADLIANPVSGAPGFQIGNVFVMAGVPKIFIGMLSDIEGRVEEGPSIVMSAIRTDLPESRLFQPLKTCQDQYDDVSIGSYPMEDGEDGGVSIVLRGLDRARVAAALADVSQAVSAAGGAVMGGDKPGRATGADI
ncbi:MAG: molybdopterin-binding protein [Pseudomonadota bacterium]